MIKRARIPVLHLEVFGSHKVLPSLHQAWRLQYQGKLTGVLLFPTCCETVLRCDQINVKSWHRPAAVFCLQCHRHFVTCIKVVLEDTFIETLVHYLFSSISHTGHQIIATLLGILPDQPILLSSRSLPWPSTRKCKCMIRCHASLGAC